MGGVQVGLYVVVAFVAIVAVIAAYRLDEQRNTTGRGLWAVALDRLLGARASGDAPASRGRRLGLALVPILLLTGVAVAGVWFATSGSRELTPPPATSPGASAAVGDAQAADAADADTDAGTGAALADVEFPEPPADAAATDVAILVSEQVVADGNGQNVVLARDEASSDAIVAGALQSLLDAPLLFTSGEAMSPATLAEIDRMGRPAVHILGGQDVLSTAAEEELVAAGHDVHRHAGITGVETAVDVAARHFPEAESAVVAPHPASGSSAFTPAFLAGAAAAAAGVPVLLSDAGGLSEATADHLAASAITSVTVVGGEDVLGAAVLDDLAALGVTADRVDADDPAALAVSAAQHVGTPDVPGVVLAEGQSDGAWPGLALTGVLAGRYAAAVVLSEAGGLPPPTVDFLSQRPGVPLLCMPGVDAVACEAARQAVAVR